MAAAGCGQGLGVADRHQLAGHARLDQFVDAGAGRADHGHAQQQALDCGVGEVVHPRRQDRRLRLGQHRVEFGLGELAQPHHA
jgi:hypothetical protein